MLKLLIDGHSRIAEPSGRSLLAVDQTTGWRWIGKIGKIIRKGLICRHDVFSSDLSAVQTSAVTSQHEFNDFEKCFYKNNNNNYYYHQ